jgi:hypothetical protein
MHPDPQPFTTLSRHSLDLILRVDLHVGWRMTVHSSQGQTAPPDSGGTLDTGDVYTFFENRYAALLQGNGSHDALLDAITHAVPVWMREFGTEFEIPGFESCFHQYEMCLDCLDSPECSYCNKTGCVTHVYRSHLVAVCTVNEVFPKPAPSPSLPPPSGSLPSASRLRIRKRWLWTIPVAALATIVMAVSIGLRMMLYPEVIVVQRQASPPASSPQVPEGPAAPESLSPKPPISAETTHAPQPVPGTSPWPSDVPPGPLPDENTTPPTPEPQRKPSIPTVRPSASPAPPAPAPVPAPASGRAVTTPTSRLQRALAELGFYRGAISGDLDEATRQGLAEFLARVPPATKSKFGPQVAAMAEAAARGEFTLKAKPGSEPPTEGKATGIR